MSVPDSTQTPSKTRVDKAGRRLREDAIEPVLLDPEIATLLENDIAVLNAYRQTYAGPLLSVRMGLTSFRNTIGCPSALITQRTKRFDRIVLKLVRFPTVRLSQMQDVGGIRVVLSDLQDEENMVERILLNWQDDVVRHDDYVADPQPSGYRGHHIVVKRAGRIVEVQVRTENQHTWAESVESSGRLIDRELKWGDGPGEVLGYYSLLGAVVDSADRGETISRSTLQATEAAREAAIRRMLDMSRGDTNG